MGIVRPATEPSESRPMKDSRPAPSQSDADGSLRSTLPNASKLTLPRKSSWRVRFGFDAAVAVLIVAFGALQFACYQRSGQFDRDDVFFVDAGRNILANGYYGIDGQPETNQPPGLPAILGALCATAGCTPANCMRALIAFGTLGFIMMYSLLKRETSKWVGACVCLVLISSPVYFDLATRWIFPAFPYFLTTTAALLIIRGSDTYRSAGRRVVRIILMAVLVVASLMIASAAVAMLAAIMVWIAITYFRDRRLARARLLTFLPLLVLGIAAQGFWMHHRRVEAQWPLPGYPASYLSQLKVKSGNHPELGTATLVDIPIRVAGNAVAHASLLSNILLRRGTLRSSTSVLILGPLLLAFLGWMYSIWKTGGSVMDWYFAGYEAIYLLWPWQLEDRFFLPIAPLACLYIFRGLQALAVLVKNKPRALSLVWLPFCIPLVMYTWVWVWKPSILGPIERLQGGSQAEFSFAVWLVTACVSGWMAWTGESALLPISAALDRHPGRQQKLARVACVLGAAMFGYLLVSGLDGQLAHAKENLHFKGPESATYPDVEAAIWIRSHTPLGAVVMARHVPVTHHHSQRRTVWFPPISNPQVLMDGIRRLGVSYLIVVNRKNDTDYYMPPDEVCFAKLQAAQPGMFRLVFERSDVSVFQYALANKALASHSN